MNRARELDRVLVYENDPVVGANMIAYFAIGTFAFSLFLAWYVFTSMAWGGVLAPLGQRAGFAAVIAGMGVGFFVWAWLHNHTLTERIFYRANDDMLELEHPTFVGHALREVPMAALENANFHSGDPEGERRVNQPWVRIGVRGGRGFIVNLPGHVERYEVFAELLERAGFDAEDAFIKQALVEQHG